MDYICFYFYINIMIVLSDYDIVIINSSAGKDSLCSIYEICRIAKQQDYSFDNIHVSHQDLGDMEWAGTKELAKIQADLFGLQIHYSKRRNQSGYEETLLEYVERRGKWPSNKQRFCTSDFKRCPGGRIVTALTKGIEKCKVLHVFGFRAEESPSRRKKEILKINQNLTTRNRTVFDFLPIHEWSTKRVWNTIKTNNLPYHYAYDLGMPRLSCCFCIFSPFDALVIAGYANPQLLDKYIITEIKIGHTFRNKFSIEDVKKAIKDNYHPKIINDWVM
jgi:3'-phosphoadenosine 5'-phosphosulfate sulfotransferase (PAPS reductase)/FAD synthetase